MVNLKHHSTKNGDKCISVFYDDGSRVINGAFMPNDLDYDEKIDGEIYTQFISYNSVLDKLDSDIHYDDESNSFVDEHGAILGLVFCPPSLSEDEKRYCFSKLLVEGLENYPYYDLGVYEGKAPVSLATVDSSCTRHDDSVIYDFRYSGQKVYVDKFSTHLLVIKNYKDFVKTESNKKLVK